MRKRAIAVGCVLASSYLGVAPAPSFAASICWIDHIAEAEGGVDVYFMQKASLRIGVAGPPGGTAAHYTSSNGVVRDEGGHAQDHLFVRDGGEFYASQRVEDTCSYKVGANETIGQVTAKSAMHLPGLTPAYTTQIIRAEGTVSAPE